MRFKAEITFVILISSLFGSLVLNIPALFASQDPEYEITRILHELDEEKVRIQSMTQIRSQASFEVNETLSQQFFRDAEENFQNQAWVAVVRNLNSYLNSSQKTESAPYLKAQYMLGYAYQQLGYDERAARAYLRYLATFITEKNYNDQRLQNVLHRLLSIYTNISERQQQQLRELLSAIASLDLPRQLKAEVLFLNALTASHSRVSKFSEEWFQEVQKLTDDPRLKAQALFYSGMLAVKLQRFEDAEDYLQKVIQISAPSADDYHNLARLNLARIAAMQKKTQTALGLYQLIPSNLPIFRESLNEQIHIHLDRQEYSEARAKARMLMEKYPDSLEAQRLRIRLALLSLQSGDFQNARTKITGKQQELEQMRSWLRQNFPEDEPVRHQLLIQLMEKTKPYTELPPVLQRGLTLYTRLAQIEGRLSDLRAEIRSLVLAMGRLRTDQYQPEWENRARQLEDAVRRVMALGDRISKLEYNFYKEHISAPFQVEWQRSMERRRKLFQENNPITTQRGRPHSWVQLAKANQKLADLDQKSNEIQAILAGLAYSNANTEDEWSSTHARILEMQKDRNQRIKRSIQRAAEITRSRRVRDLANQGQQIATQRLLINLALTLYDESLLMSSVRDQFTYPNQRHMAQEASLAWKKWEFLVKHLHQEIQSLDDSIRETLTNDLKVMEQLIQSHDKLQQMISELSDNIARTLGHSMPANIAHLNRWIEGNQARLWKWEADLSWLDYVDQSRTRQEQHKEFEIRSMTVKEDLRDLEQRNRQ